MSARLAGEVVDLRAQLDTAHTTAEGLRTGLADAENARRDAQAELRAERAALAEVRRQVEQLHTDRRQAEQDAATARAEVARLQAQLDQAQGGRQ